jgi:hypothetical protein
MTFRYQAHLSARRRGAIGCWESVLVYFRADAELTTRDAQHAAALIAADQLGWEPNHVRAWRALERDRAAS